MWVEVTGLILRHPPGAALWGDRAQTAWHQADQRIHRSWNSAHAAAPASIAPASRNAQAAPMAQTAAAQTESVRKMLLAFSKDLRVVMLRLASRLQTLRFFAATKLPVPDGIAAVIAVIALGILPPDVIEELPAPVVKKARRTGTIKAEALFGAEEIRAMSAVDLEIAIQRIKRKKRRRDDEYLLLM